MSDGRRPSELGDAWVSLLLKAGGFLVLDLARKTEMRSSAGDSRRKNAGEEGIDHQAGRREGARKRSGSAAAQRVLWVRG